METNMNSDGTGIVRPLVYTVDETSALLQMGRTSTYAAIKRNQIPHVIIGHKILIPAAALDELLDVGAREPKA
jgi:excisionase family DNA binding protein